MADTESASVLVLPRVERKAPRAYIVGATDTGKSTLMEAMTAEYQKAWSLPKNPVRVLICDTKPRFRAELEINGLPAKRRYSKWGYGASIIPGSYILPGLDSTRAELDAVWRLGGTVAIATAERKQDRERVAHVARTFYESYGAKSPRLLVVDELADFYEWRSLGDIFQQIARAGRERDCAMICGSQRPRKIPVETMTEMTRMYLFELNYWEDIKHVAEFGLPPAIQIPQGHAFYMWDRKLKYSSPSHGYYELDLSTNYWTGQPFERVVNE